MHLARMTDTEIADELGMVRQTAQRSIERSERLHANDGSMEHLQACLENTGTGEPEDDPSLTPEQNGRVWDRWAAGLTVADIERIAATQHSALLLHRLRLQCPDLPLDVRRAINVAYGALPGPDEDDVEPHSWRAGVVKALARARGTQTSDPADDDF
jgi:hypothetical protein